MTMLVLFAIGLAVYAGIVAICAYVTGRVIAAGSAHLPPETPGGER